MVLSAQEHVTDSSASDLAASQSLSSGSVSPKQVKQKVKTLWTALVLLSTFFCVELSAGIWSHSLSLLADAQHILSDVAALGLALLAIWLSNSMSKGTIFKRYRLEVLAALINGIGLACIAVWIVKEALVRLQSPDPEILGLPMLATALIGLAVNGINTFYLHGCSHHDLNLKGVFLHFLADLVSSVGAVLAAIAVIWLNWTWADGVISLAVALLIALFAAYLLIQSVNCLRGQVTDIANASCMCNLPADACSDRSSAEKLLFPSLQELIK